MRSINPKQARFVDEYLVDLNATQAATRAGYSAKTAFVQASKMLSNPKIQQAVAGRMADREQRTEITQDMVLKMYYQIATADPSEICRVDVDCCRFCWGEGNAYQWTESEYRSATEKAIDEGKDTPDGSGGFGFDPRREPNQDCPECHGHGVEEVRISDTRKLKGAARRLYAGVKRTKNGIEIQMRDQDGALAKLAQHVGLSIDKKEISGSLSINNVKAEDLTDDQLAAIAKISDGE